MKILIASNPPFVATGYGTQTASLALRMKKAGHDVSIYANYGLHGGVITWQGIPILPGATDGYEDPIIDGHLRSVQPDLLLTLFDAWAWRETPWPPADIKWAAWAPVDHEPLSKGNALALHRTTYPIAMSQHGERMMTDAGLHPTYIPHGIEKTFGFTSSGRREFRRYLQVPDDAFLFGTVGLHRYYPHRKALDRLLAALAQVPDAYLYIHSLPDSQAGSIDLREIADFYKVSDRVKYADTYNYVMGYSQNGMNGMYSAMDCYVQPTMGEGFGLPVLEAQACGAVVIATDCTSMPELLCPEASMLVPAATEFFVPDISHRYLIDIPKLAEAMNEAVELKASNPDGWASMKARAGIWANNWDWDRIWNEAWVPFLNTVESDAKLSPRTKQHRGRALVYELDGKMRKQDSTLQSPAVKKELDLLLRLAHPNIASPIEHGTTEDGCTWFDMPMLMPLNSVNMALHSANTKDKIINGVRSALDYLHENNLSHRDVHPANVLLTESFDPILIDFEWAHPCEGEPCVDFRPWDCLDKAVPIAQLGIEQRGFHTIVAYVRGISIDDAMATGLPGVPYQAIDGVGERDCQTRWDMIKPDVKGKTILDLGCNLGWFVRKSLEEGAISAVGVDHDLVTIEAARSLGGDFVCDDLNKPIIDTSNYDVIFCFSVLQHINDPDTVFDWMLRHGREVYIETPLRFITPHMAETLAYAEHIGESERGRPVYKIEVAPVAA